MTTPPVLNLNGYTDLPPGKVASVVTYLEMHERPSSPRAPQPVGLSLHRLTGETGRYRDLFRLIGEHWLWFSRAGMSDEKLAETIGDPNVEAYALNDGKADIGLLELDFYPDGDAELMYLGLVPGSIGKGAGRFLIEEAIHRAFDRPIRRFFVHTCSLDHPGALAFYMRAGLKPYKQAIEVVDDPRLLGVLPRGAAPHVPIFTLP